jgi:thioredoxin 2
MTTAEIIRCSQCGANNRVSAEQIKKGLLPVCGRCKTPLSLEGHSGPVVVTDETFAAEVERSSLPVLVDMWAPWCGPCRMVAPVIDQLAAEMGGRVRFAKLNVDENQKTAGRFNISSIPALVVFKGGREVDRIIGLQPKGEIARRLQNIVGG